MRRITLLIAALAVVASGCEHSTQPGIMTNPSIKPLRLAAPDPAYRLTPADRARVVPGYDADALERLMALINPELRPQILKNFLMLSREELAPGEDIGVIAELYDSSTGRVDPLLQAALEDVYAPLWADVSDGDLEKSNLMFYPGREREKQRREQRRREGGEPKIRRP